MWKHLPYRHKDCHVYSLLPFFGKQIADTTLCDAGALMAVDFLTADPQQLLEASSYVICNRPSHILFANSGPSCSRHQGIPVSALKLSCKTVLLPRCYPSPKNNKNFELLAKSCLSLKI